jgi:hypothetical protein
VAGQRVLSSVVLFLIAAAGMILLRPEWFPDIQLPSVLAGMGWERSALGGFLLVLVGVILVGVGMEGGRSRRDRRSHYIPPAPPAPDPAPETETYITPRPRPEPSWGPRPSFSRPELVPMPIPKPVAVAEETEPEVTTEQSHEAPGHDLAMPEAPDEAAQPDEAEQVVQETEQVVEEAAVVAPAAGQTVDADDTEAALRQARAHQAANPQDLRASIAVAEALTAAAAQDKSGGRSDAALQHHEESLAIHRAAASDGPFDPQLASGLVGALGRLGDCIEARGDRDRARELYAEAVRISQRLTWLAPDSQEYAGALAHAEARYSALEPAAPPQGTPAE